MSIFGSSFAGSSLCPHCQSHVDRNAYGMVASHTSHITGTTCSGSGVPPMPVPPWPGNAPRLRSAFGRRKSASRKRRSERKAARVAMGQ